MAVVDFYRGFNIDMNGDEISVDWRGTPNFFDSVDSAKRFIDNILGEEEDLGD